MPGLKIVKKFTQVTGSPPKPKPKPKLTLRATSSGGGTPAKKTTVTAEQPKEYQASPSKTKTITKSMQPGGAEIKGIPKKKTKKLRFDSKSIATAFTPYHTFKALADQAPESSEYKKRNLTPEILYGKAIFVGATQFPKTVYKTVASPFTGTTKKDYEDELVEYEKKTEKKVRKKDYVGFVKDDVLLSPAYTDVVYPLAAGYVIGAGVGATKAAYPVAGKAVEGGIAVGGTAYAGYETHKVATETPEYLPEHFARMGFQAAITFPAYKAGHTAGYGRTEAYLYKKHSFKPGSKEAIRFEEQLKISRWLENVKSKKAKPIDFTKDVTRVDPKTGERINLFLKKEPKTVVGGSAASKTQVFKARTPRDVDILVPEKKLTMTKKFFKGYTKTPKGEHKIDIHTFEYGGKAGRYHRFGFETKSPTKIGGTKYMRAGEQVFRKGIAGTTKETQYRWFKDVPDFVTTSKSQIRSASPWRGKIASKHLQRFLHPKTSPKYGKSGKWDIFIRKITKPPVTPKTTVEPSGYFSYTYPSYVYPKGVTVFPYYTPNKYNKPKTVVYKPSVYKPDKKTIIPPYKPKKEYKSIKPFTITPHTPPYKPKPYIPPKYTPGKPPTTKTTPYTPLYKPSKYTKTKPPKPKPIFLAPSFYVSKEKRKKEKPIVFGFEKYRFRMKKIKSPLEGIKL